MSTPESLLPICAPPRALPAITVVFDFDGTLSWGDGPILSYAHHASAATSDPAGFLAQVTRSLQTPEIAIDGYDLVRQLATGAGVSEIQLAAAYRASRHELASAAAPISAPAEVRAFLDSLAPHATLVLATNAPETRLDAALRELGLDGRFDAIHTDTNKPAGLEDVLDRWSSPKHPGGLLSIGDVWANDLEPAARRGSATALVGPHHQRVDISPTFRAETLPELYSPVLAWAQSHLSTDTPAPLTVSERSHP